MKPVMANDAWEFCTNGYPDPDAWANFLHLVIGNARVGQRTYGGAIGRGYVDLEISARTELAAMGHVAAA